MLKNKRRIIFTAIFLAIIALLFFLKSDFILKQEIQFKTSTVKGEVYTVSGDIVDSFKTIRDGAMVISNKKIVWIGKKANLLIDKGKVIETNGYIYPGFIDSHNHPSYNFIKRWESEPVYTNRYQWSKEKYYKKITAPRRALLKNKDTYSAINRYSEVKELISGSTTIQGCPHRTELIGLVRNIESYNGLKEDKISTSIFPLQPREKARAANIITAFERGHTTHHIIHAGEGIDKESLEEFYELEKLGLIRKGLIIIHGTAFTEKEFKKMKEKEVHLVWSPKSNISLYNATTKVDVADKNGVLISLAPDWNISGSNNMLEEYQYAQIMNLTIFNKYFTLKDLFDMMTINPAKMLGFDKYIGSLEVGKRADYCVYRKINDDPFENLLKCSVKHVDLVAIDGRIYYGKKEFIEKTQSLERFNKLSVKGEIKYLNIFEENPKNRWSQNDFKTVVEHIHSRYEELAELAGNVKLIK